MGLMLVLPVFIHRFAGDLFKELAEIFGVGIAHLFADVVDVANRGIQQPFCIVDAHKGSCSPQSSSRFPY